MSCFVGIGSGSYKEVKDIQVGVGGVAKNVNYVKRWDGAILWQRAITLTASNTRFSVDTTNCSKTSSAGYWNYTLTPAAYKSYSGDGQIEYYNGSSWITLTENVDYTVGWKNNSGRLPTSGTTTGSATATGYVVITGIGSYTGSFDKSFTITYTYVADTKDITGKCTINLSASSKTLTDTSKSYTATDEDLTIGISSVYYNGTTVMTQGTDYTVSYTYPSDKSYSHSSEGTLSKTVTVTVTGTGKYTGSASTTYTVYHKYAIARVRPVKLYSSDSGLSPKCYYFTPPSTSISSASVGPSYDNTYVIGMCYGNGYNYAILHNRNVCRSYNGASWDVIGTTLSDVNPPNDCCFGNGVIVATYSGGILYSSDGINWNKATLVSAPSAYEGTNFTSCSYINGKFYCVAPLYTWVSSDSTGSQFNYYDNNNTGTGKIIYGNGVFVKYKAGTSTAVRWTTDPTLSDWDRGTQPSWNGITSCAFGNGIFVGGYTSAHPYISTDGITWTEGSGIYSIQGICFVDGYFYALNSTTSKFKIYRSSDGTSWSEFIEDVPTSDENRIDLLAY